MATIKIRADFLRVARAFTHGATGVYGAIFPEGKPSPLAGIFVEPHPSGIGVQIVSSDGCAMCVQWDQKGEVDRGRLITGISHAQAIEFSGATLSDRWVEGGPDKLSLVAGSKRPSELVGVKGAAIDVREDPGIQPGSARYPAWRHYLMSDEQKRHLTPGFPGMLSMAYLRIISRLYEDGTQNDRQVKFYSHAGFKDLHAILLFPWRPFMQVYIMPMLHVPEQWSDLLVDLTSAAAKPSMETAESTPLGDTPAGDDDPAAGL